MAENPRTVPQPPSTSDAPLSAAGLPLAKNWLAVIAPRGPRTRPEAAG